MLILKVGTRLKEREQANIYIRDNFNMSNGFIENGKVILKKESLASITQYLELDIFGDKVKVYLEDWNAEDYRDYVYKYLEEIRESKNIFVIDEVEMLDATFNKLAKYTYKDTIFDAREDKVKESAFYLCDLIMQKNKEKAWLEYRRLLEVGEPIESIVGAMIHKVKMSRVNNKTDFLYTLMSMTALDHDGKLSANSEFEKLILSL